MPDPREKERDRNNKDMQDDPGEEYEDITEENEEEEEPENE
jgi:hypothetical protein